MALIGNGGGFFFLLSEIKNTLEIIPLTLPLITPFGICLTGTVNGTVLEAEVTYQQWV